MFKIKCMWAFIYTSSWYICWNIWMYFFFKLRKIPEDCKVLLKKIVSDTFKWYKATWPKIFLLKLRYIKMYVVRFLFWYRFYTFRWQIRLNNVKKALHFAYIAICFISTYKFDYHWMEKCVGPVRRKLKISWERQKNPFILCA